MVRRRRGTGTTAFGKVCCEAVRESLSRVYSDWSGYLSDEDGHLRANPEMSSAKRVINNKEAVERSFRRSDLLRLFARGLDCFSDGAFCFVFLLFTTHIPIVDEPSPLHRLRGCVGRMTCEQEVVARLHFPS